MGESRTLRDRQSAAGQAIDGLPSGNRACADAMLVMTTSVKNYPNVAAAFYACNPCRINGPTVEGGAATYVPDTSTVVYCWNNGSQVPPQGTVAVAHGVAGKTVITYNGG